MTIRRKVVERIGLLDEGYFFAGEEADWCYRMKGKGWKVYYYPEAAVIHHRRGSCKGMEGRAFTQTRKSALRFYEKHYGRWETELMRFSVSIVLLLKILGTGFRLVFSSDRQELLARIEVYLAVLRLHYDRNFRAMNMFYEVPYLYNLTPAVFQYGAFMPQKRAIEGDLEPFWVLFCPVFALLMAPT